MQPGVENYLYLLSLVLQIKVLITEGAFQLGICSVAGPYGKLFFMYGNFIPCMEKKIPWMENLNEALH